MFATQAWEPEFDHQNPCERVEQSTVVHTWNSNASEAEKRDPYGTLARKLRTLVEFQGNGRPCSKGGA